MESGNTTSNGTPVSVISLSKPQKQFACAQPGLPPTPDPVPYLPRPSRALLRKDQSTESHPFWLQTCLTLRTKAELRQNSKSMGLTYLSYSHLTLTRKSLLLMNTWLWNKASLVARLSGSSLKDAVSSWLHAWIASTPNTSTENFMSVVAHTPVFYIWKAQNICAIQSLSLVAIKQKRYLANFLFHVSTAPMACGWKTYAFFLPIPSMSVRFIATSATKFRLLSDLKDSMSSRTGKQSSISVRAIVWARLSYISLAHAFLEQTLNIDSTFMFTVLLSARLFGHQMPLPESASCGVLLREALFSLDSALHTP